MISTYNICLGQWDYYITTSHCAGQEAYVELQAGALAVAATAAEAMAEASQKAQLAAHLGAGSSVRVNARGLVHFLLPAEVTSTLSAPARHLIFSHFTSFLLSRHLLSMQFLTVPLQADCLTAIVIQKGRRTINHAAYLLYNRRQSSPCYLRHFLGIYTPPNGYHLSFHDHSPAL